LVVVRRSALRDILAAALLPDTVDYGVTADSLLTADDGVQIMLSDASIRAADAVIGAYGIGSMVASHLNGPLTQRYAGYTAWRGIANCALDPDFAGQTLGLGVEVGHVPMTSEHTYWFATERIAQGQLSPDGELSYLRAKLAGWPEPVPSLLATTAPADVLRNDLYDRSPGRCWATGAVVLVGDAAHPMRPHLGQGGCQGLEDAAILAAFVDRAADLPTAFARFAAFRRPRATSVVRASELSGRAVNLRPAFLSAVLSRATAMLPEALLMRQLASVAGRSAFKLPTGG
jgi:2-polyprenyl-6-methoxyphenol hydroxylase-like FAD-dependent oxidoreductase